MGAERGSRKILRKEMEGYGTLVKPKKEVSRRLRKPGKLKRALKTSKES